MALTTGRSIHTSAPHYEFPTRIGGQFETAMRMVAQNPRERVTGTSSGFDVTDNDFKTQISQALALKLNLKTQQHANERMFRRMVASGGDCSSLKQAVQARASVYGEISDASWFTRSFDIGGKAQTLKQRRIVRSQLASAPLLVAQTGLQGVQATLGSGDDSVLEQIRLGDHYSVMHILKVLSRARPLSVLRLLNKVTAQKLGSCISQVSADLDFVQTVLDLVSRSEELNPSLNAITEAFRRRHLGGSFTSGSNSVMMDALLYADTKSTKDSDVMAAESKTSSTSKISVF